MKHPLQTREDVMGLKGKIPSGELARMFGIPKGTICRWFKSSEPLDRDARIKMQTAAQRLRRARGDA